jgi:glycosyltransferase involved in cell wall biosynthesis
MGSLEIKENNLNPLVSVCVQTYQHARFIAQCLESILIQQTNFHFEIIVGEDESSDGTREICKQYAEKYPEKIRLFLRSRKNVIYINNRPTGRFNFVENLKAAKGKYVALCEGDDYWSDASKLQKQVDILQNNPRFSMAFHNTSLVDTNGTMLTEYYIGPKKRIDRTFREVFLGKIPTATVMFRRDLINEFPKEFYKVLNADTFLFALLTQYGDAKYINEIKPSVYRIHAGGIWSSQSQIEKHFHALNTLENLLTVLKSEYKETIRYYQLIRIYKITSLYIQHSYSLKKIFQSYLSCIRANLRAKRKLKAFVTGHKEIIRSFRNNAAYKWQEE